MKILVVDDHALIREALHGVLKKLRRDSIVLEAGDWKQAQLILDQHVGIKLILLDLNLPDQNGFVALGRLRESHPTVPVVVLSGVQDRDHVLKALELGALGYIPKSARREVMLSAIQLVFAGGTYIPPEILPREAVTLPVPMPANGQPVVSPADLGIVERRLEVLALVMQGKNNKTICRILD